MVYDKLVESMLDECNCNAFNTTQKTKMTTKQVCSWDRCHWAVTQITMF